MSSGTVADGSSPLPPPVSGVPADVEALTTAIIDPPNRFIRYPLARGLFRIAGGLPFTPNQITYTHAALGVCAAGIVAFASETWFPLVFVLCEVRAVLDCYDGEVARGKKLFSPWGRTIDELSDAVSFLAMNFAFAYRIHTPMAYLMTFLVIQQGAISAWSYDFFKRKFTLALREAKDSIALELTPKLERKRQGSMTFLPAFSLFFDMLQVNFLSRHSRAETLLAARDGATNPALYNTTDVRRVRAAAKSKKFRFTLSLLSLMTGDNTFLLLSLGLVFKNLYGFQLITAGYGYVLLALGFLFAQSVLRTPTAAERGRANSAAS